MIIVKLCHFVKIVRRHLYISSTQWIGDVDMHTCMYATCDQNTPCGIKSYEFSIAGNRQTTDCSADPKITQSEFKAHWPIGHLLIYIIY